MKNNMLKVNKNLKSFFKEDCTIVFLHAHADDEAFLSAGIMQELINAGRKCIIIFTACAMVKNQPKTLIRQQEVKESCKILGFENVLYLKYCEPKYFEEDSLRLIEQSPDDVAQSIMDILTEFNICEKIILISYDKNGGYGNADHKIVHLVGRICAERFKSKIDDLFEITLNRNKIIDWLNYAQKLLPEKSIPKLSYWSKDFGLANSEITHFYELTQKQLIKKREALRVHVSQMSNDEFPLSLDENNFKEVFGKEFLYKVKG